jgi:hypothetical protein
VPAPIMRLGMAPPAVAEAPTAGRAERPHPATRRTSRPRKSPLGGGIGNRGFLSRIREEYALQIKCCQRPPHATAP